MKDIYSMNTYYEGINADNIQLELDREYFHLNPKRSHYIRERLPNELGINSPYVLVIKLGENERTRFPSETITIPRQKIKKLRKISLKKIKQQRS